jgi:hypothetical protein
MGNVINLFAKTKEENPPLSFSEIADYCKEALISDWEMYSKKNKLQEFIFASIVPYGDELEDYTCDLNALSLVELRIGISTSIHKVDSHWVAGFTVDDLLITTPRFGNEALARAFNILMFMKIRREVNKLNGNA